MGEIARFPIVSNHTFIEATRDTGYRSTAAAAAELVDNAVQAEAKNVRVIVREEPGGVSLAVMDDGTGMDGQTLRRALQFGGSMRFGDRAGMGRFGMGLPNASVSQARRVDVYTWRAPNTVISSHLDVDDIAAGEVEEIPVVKRSAVPEWAAGHRGFSGTLIVWSRCDRLDNRRVSTIARKLHEPLGRMFRHFIWRGVSIWVNDEQVAAIDPMFLHPSGGLSRATPFGDPLTFEVRVPGDPTRTSPVMVRFSELPVAQWHDMHVEEKRRHHIVDGAGLSILRAGREVDYGWWFFGAKRRENYDSWWRGELSFEPALDELFAITHSKQGINPTAELREILTPDLEAVARQLNGRVQDAFARVKTEPSKPASTPQPMSSPPPPSNGKKPATKSEPAPRPTVIPLPKPEPEPEYTVVIERIEGDAFFDARRVGGRWRLALNKAHTFYKTVYAPLRTNDVARRHVELMILAFAKAEALNPPKRIDPDVLRAGWASQLAGLLEAAE